MGQPWVPFEGSQEPGPLALALFLALTLVRNPGPGPGLGAPGEPLGAFCVSMWQRIDIPGLKQARGGH